MVTTKNGGATTTTQTFQYLAKPVVSAVSPTVGTTSGGTSIVISGTDFDSYTSVTLNGVACTVTSSTGTPITQLTCTTGATSSGTYAVIVTTSTGGISDSSSSVTFTFTAAPVVTGIAPVSGVAGTTISISGTDLGQNEADITSVTINGATCAISSVSGTPVTSIVCVAGTSDATGSFPIIVTSATGGTGTTASGVTFTYTGTGALESTTNSAESEDMTTTYIIIGVSSCVFVTAVGVLIVLIWYCCKKRREGKKKEFVDPEGFGTTKSYFEDDRRSPDRVSARMHNSASWVSADCAVDLAGAGNQEASYKAAKGAPLRLR